MTLCSFFAMIGVAVTVFVVVFVLLVLSQIVTDDAMKWRKK